MKKKIVLIALVAVLSIFSIASAAVTYPYGSNQYGSKNILFKGNLDASGLGVDFRNSTANRHDLKLHNVNSGSNVPASGFLQTVQYDIQPNANEPPNKFSKISGYHVVRLEEELIKDLAQKANGNPDYVWAQISQKAQQAKASASKISDPVYFYSVDSEPYIGLGAVIYYSGGGDPEMVEAGGNGVTSPLFQSTYKTTNWPEILELSQEGQGIKVKATGYSVFDTSINGRITTNSDSSTARNVFTKSAPVQNYGVTYEGIVPFSQLAGLKPGENTVTLRVGDTFGRTAEKTITVTVGPIQQPNLSVTKLESSPASPMRKGQATINAWVKNESDQLISSLLTLQIDGKKVGEQTITLEPGEEKSFPFTATMPDAAQTVARATVNPDHTKPAEETTWDDNTKDLSIPLSENPKLNSALNLVLTLSNGGKDLVSSHAGAWFDSYDSKSVSIDYYNNPNKYSVRVKVFRNFNVKSHVNTTVKMVNAYKISEYVVPKPPPCEEGPCDPPPPPYWTISNEVQTVTKNIALAAGQREAFVTFDGIIPSYTHTTEKDDKGNPIDEPLEAPKNDTKHELYFIVNEARNPTESDYTDNYFSQIVPVWNRGYQDAKGILIQ